MSTVVEVSVTHRLGAFALEAGFASDGRLTALFGLTADLSDRQAIVLRKR